MTDACPSHGWCQLLQDQWSNPVPCMTFGRYWWASALRSSSLLRLQQEPGRVQVILRATHRLGYSSSKCFCEWKWKAQEQPCHQKASLAGFWPPQPAPFCLCHFFLHCLMSCRGSHTGCTIPDYQEFGIWASLQIWLISPSVSNLSFQDSMVESTTLKNVASSLSRHLQ